MDNFVFWSEGLVFIGIFLAIVGFPCIMVAILGTKLIDHIGQYPSKSAKMQMVVCLQLFFVEVVSFVTLALFYHIFSD